MGQCNVPYALHNLYCWLVSTLGVAPFNSHLPVEAEQLLSYGLPMPFPLSRGNGPKDRDTSLLFPSWYSVLYVEPVYPCHRRDVYEPFLVLMVPWRPKVC
jgi:hypothetical protein